MRSNTNVLATILMLGVVVTSAQNDSLYLSPSEFMYADNPRYNIGGGTPRRVTEIQPLTTVGFGLGYTALLVGLHINQRNAWWSNGSGDFHVLEDLQYARGLDKFGHVYTTYVMSTFCSDMLMECGLDHSASIWAGGGMGLAYTLYVEIEDGFATNWGFSPSDAIANVVGSSFFVAQSKIPFLQNFTPRWSYVPAEWLNEATINGRPQKTFIDDYNSTTFWLACNVNNLLPTDAANYWPDWLMFSFGYGIRNYDVNNADGTPVGVTRRFLFGLDYDWVKIIPPSSSGFVNYLRQALNYIRLPGPTLEVGDEGVKFGLFYPFIIRVPI